jgi:hypothetical protein
MTLISKSKPNPPSYKTNLVFGFIYVISLGGMLAKNTDALSFVQLVQIISLMIYCFSLSTKPLNDKVDADNYLPNQQI